MSTPTIAKIDIYPVAGHDCMELNLSGAHGPYFTRNIAIITDSEGNVGIGEVPGGEKITQIRGCEGDRARPPSGRVQEHSGRSG